MSHDIRAEHYGKPGFSVRYVDHGMLVYGELALDELDLIGKLAEERGYDKLHPGIAAAEGATFALSNDAEIKAWKKVIDDRGDGNDLQKWLDGWDTGISSMTIVRVLTNHPAARSWRPGIPYDPADFGRCYRLLQVVPEFRDRLGEVADAYPAWAGLVEHWSELEALYEEEEPTGAAPKLYARMKELRG